MGVQINGDTGNISATKADYSGNVTIGGTLTYEDVTNIDSVGLVTARSGLEVGARPGVGASISVDGNAEFAGIVTATSFKDANGVGINTANVRTGILDVAGVSTFRSNIFQTGGRIVRGSTSTIQDGDAIAGGVNITGTDMDASVIMSVFGNDGDFNRISGAKSRNATIGSHTVVNDGDTLLSIKGFGSDGTNFEEAAQLEFQVDGSPGDNDMPGRMVFKTTADGASSPTERLRIDKDGYVTKPNTPFFSVYGISDNATYNDGDEITFENATHNVGSHFKMTSGTGQYKRFIVPVAGVYIFTFGFFPNTASSCRISLAINGTVFTAPYISGSFSNWGTGQPAPSGAQMLKLSVDDYVTVKVTSGTLSNTYDGHTAFQGFLLG